MMMCKPLNAPRCPSAMTKSGDPWASSRVASSNVDAHRAWWPARSSTLSIAATPTLSLLTTRIWDMRYLIQHSGLFRQCAHLSGEQGKRSPTWLSAGLYNPKRPSRQEYQVSNGIGERELSIHEVHYGSSTVAAGSGDFPERLRQTRPPEANRRRCRRGAGRPRAHSGRQNADPRG